MRKRKFRKADRQWHRHDAQLIGVFGVILGTVIGALSVGVLTPSSALEWAQAIGGPSAALVALFAGLIAVRHEQDLHQQRQAEDAFRKRMEISPRASDVLLELGQRHISLADAVLTFAAREMDRHGVLPPQRELQWVTLSFKDLASHRAVESVNNRWQSVENLNTSTLVELIDSSWAYDPVTIQNAKYLTTRRPLYYYVESLLHNADTLVRTTDRKQMIRVLLNAIDTIDEAVRRADAAADILLDMADDGSDFIVSPEFVENFRWTIHHIRVVRNELAEDFDQVGHGHHASPSRR